MNDLRSKLYEYRFWLGTGLLILLIIGGKSISDGIADSKSEVRASDEHNASLERRRMNNERLAAIESAKTPEQRESEKKAHEAKAIADEKARVIQAKEDEQARIAKAKIIARAEKERMKRPENIIMANARASAKIYEESGMLVVECREYIFPYDINSRLRWVRAVCDADATIQGGPRSIFFYDPSGKKFAQADKLSGIRLME